MDLTFKTDYWDDLESKNEFLQFLIQIHGLDLARWNRHGFWNRKFRPFSFFKEKTLVSSLCLYSMDMSVMGKRCRVAQISGVGTLPEFRRQGLSSELTRKAMDWARPNHDFFYLFADRDAYSFYKRAGFRLVEEHMVCCPADGRPPLPGAVKLNVQQPDHLDLIYSIATEREAVSDILGVYNERLLMFWCLYFLADNIYYIDALKTLVLYKHSKGVLSVLDIISKKVLPFSKIYPYISSADDKNLEFRFMVDKMNLGQYEEVKLEEENGTHLYGDFPLEGRNFIFPCTSQA